MDALSAATGIPEPTLRLLTSVLAAYPIAGVQRSLLKPSRTPAARNAFNVASGLAVAYFFCGADIVHSLVTITATYLICLAGQVALAPKQRWLAAAAAFVFNCAYLLIAYVFTASEEYDINWTTPQSVLCLRLIGFAFDFADGSKHAAAAVAKKNADAAAAAAEPVRAASPGVDSGTEVAAAAPAAPAPAAAPRRIETEANRTPTAWAGDLSLATLPSYFEVLGYAYFTGSFLVGPQFSFALYRRYLSLDLFRTHTPVGTSTPAAISMPIPQLLSTGAKAAAKTFGLAVGYLAVTQVLSMFFSSAIVLTPAFLDAPYYHRLALAWMAGKTALTKYLGVWILTEGACILSGMGFDGVDANGHPRWSGLANIDALGFETATSLARIIGTFNINTNNWAKLYLFKRLRFLGNKHLSSVGTLAFLAIWHGFHPSYAYAFSLEFVDMIVESRLKNTCKPLVAALSKSAAGRIVVNFTCWLLTTSALYYAALGFDLLTAKNIIIAANSLYWIGHLALPALFVLTAVFPGPKPPKPAAKTQ
ncbi:hypothetical protein H9P43_001502 [Blastocladiella emersonii ATCC 22665]|nr:hypothetical protein H9P43_001502 [Blastocladiella emersonii ATCC 22665]